LSNNLTWEFNFDEISKRRFGRTYIEQTSYDTNARDGDFFNPVEVGRGGLVLFEDYGPGIFERLLWFHRTDYHSNMDYVIFEVGHYLTIGSVMLFPFPKQISPKRVLLTAH
jgi:hypothetical protein